MRRILPTPTFIEEQIQWDRGLSHIAGVDEVGRGAFAGPIVAAAVILHSDFVNSEINDSKLLTERKREILDLIIREQALCYSISTVSLSYINRYGIGKANQLALCNAIKNLTIQPEFTLVDAFKIKNIKTDCQKAIIKGDQKSISIAAASIIAKVYRDSLMKKIADKFPQYRFDANKGYGTLEHRNSIKKTA